MQKIALRNHMLRRYFFLRFVENIDTMQKGKKRGDA